MAKRRQSLRKDDKANAGRKRNPELDKSILEAAIQTLAEIGFDAMTMDEVAARAKSAKTTVYRRWPSKAELVRDALIWMSKSSVDTQSMPDTGSLREDLLSVQKDYSADFAERKVRVLSGLGSFFTNHAKAAKEASAGIFEPMLEINRKIFNRAIERGDIPRDADIEVACQTIIATIVYRTQIQTQSFDKTQYARLLDAIILPALSKKTKGGSGRR